MVTALCMQPKNLFHKVISFHKVIKMAENIKFSRR